MDVNGLNIPFLPVGGVDTLKQQPKQKFNQQSESNFADFLNQELIKFSGHAQNRIESRDVNLNDVDVLRLDEAVEKVRKKGGHESLVMLDNKVFIVAVDSKTVITLFDKQNMENDVITNIDSAVFA